MSFGASKYMKHGAADKGHGGPEGHTHPTMTLSSRETSGGGSSSSSSNTTGGGSSSSRQSTDNLKNYQAGLVDLGSDFKPTAEQTRAANARVAELKKKDADAAAANAANATSSSSSSNTTNAGSSTTKWLKRCYKVIFYKKIETSSLILIEKRLTLQLLLIQLNITIEH
jgi:hypothetical protein